MTESPPPALEGIAAQFAKAKQQQAEELQAGRSRDERVKRQNLKEAQNFKWNHGCLVGLLLFFFGLHAIGIYLFTSGFLLTRMVLEHKSNCSISPLEEYGDAAKLDTENGCWHPKTFDKAVIVVIDALRWDFTIPYVPEDNTSIPHHFHNAFTTPYEIASKNPQNAVLLPFIADPPTTTLQRLKGLTTGTLPTFIDAGSNFDGGAIDEDNLIAHLHKLNKRIAFLGDDTWTALFPGYFEENLTHPYESLNVWDLHTVDNGVTDHIFPLLHPDNSSKWDVVIGHYLGVDHAGHRYGPDHFAMTEKLQQMDGVIKRLVDSIDDNTLLVVMGDHGMDPKGDHGGESWNELEAALWLYSKKPVFGRLSNEYLPKEGLRNVPQIDLVPTLSLLLGLPIPFNNLGSPIAEAFLSDGKTQGWRNLAQVARLTAAQIKRYQREYSGKKDEDIEHDSIVNIAWANGQEKWGKAIGSRQSATKDWMATYEEFSDFQQKTLKICKDLWARFDLVSMVLGITVLFGTLGTLILYARGFKGDRIELTDEFLVRMGKGSVAGALISLGVAAAAGHVLPIPRLNVIFFGIAIGVISGFLSATIFARRRLDFLLPRSGWGVLSIVYTLLNAVMFGSNSFTIWEDKTLTFFLATFATCSLMASQRNLDLTERMLGTYHSIVLLVLTKIASFSKLCREEQMPYCRSTFYASATSSVSAPWTLGLLFMMALILPAIIKSFYRGTRSYEGPAPVYIGWAFRFGLFLGAIYWTLDSADNASWWPAYEALVKSSKMTIAQIVLSMGLFAGSIGYAWSSLCLGVELEGQEPSPDSPKQQDKVISESGRTILLLGYANVHGSRYFLLVLSWALALILVQKPMGGLSMGILLYQILTVLEIIDCNDLSSESIGPIILGILGNSHFYSTGHQATLTSIQWESAFIALSKVQQPWSALLIIGNTLGPQILTAIAVPLVVLWKAPPKKPNNASLDEEGMLGKIAKAAATFILFHAALATSSVACAGWLRRHLMLYRIFMPRFLLGAVTLLTAEVVAVLAGVGGVRWNGLSVGEVFGY